MDNGSSHRFDQCKWQDCTEPMSEAALLCDEHLQRVYAFTSRCPRQRPEIDWDKIAAERERKSAVYYIRMDGGRIKIGVTSNLKRRMKSFSALPDQLLAVEPGGHPRELQRHREFAHLRQPRTELFEPNDRLLAHITSVRDMFGDPTQFL